MCGAYCTDRRALRGQAHNCGFGEGGWSGSIVVLQASGRDAGGGEKGASSVSKPHHVSEHLDQIRRWSSYSELRNQLLQARQNLVLSLTPHASLHMPVNHACYIQLRNMVDLRVQGFAISLLQP